MNAPDNYDPKLNCGLSFEELLALIAEVFAAAPEEPASENPEGERK